VILGVSGTGPDYSIAFSFGEKESSGWRRCFWQFKVTHFQGEKILLPLW